jgi:hypothetical protein
VETLRIIHNLLMESSCLLGHSRCDDENIQKGRIVFGFRGFTGQARGPGPPVGGRLVRGIFGFVPFAFGFVASGG